tara:strand:- start:805 stop:1044 length:240 start_codon:yes stop_codon:yes gene_type:complete
MEFIFQVAIFIVFAFSSPKLLLINCQFLFFQNLRETIEWQQRKCCKPGKKLAISKTLMLATIIKKLLHSIKQNFFGFIK